MKNNMRMTVKSCKQIGLASIVIGIILAIILAPQKIAEIPVPAFETGVTFSIILRMCGFIWLVYDKSEFMKIVKAKDLL